MQQLQIPQESLEKLDDGSFALYLEVPGAKVVLLQAYFELYEGIGVVRTLDIRSSLVCIVVTADMLEDCMQALAAIHDRTQWKFASPPADDPAAGSPAGGNHAWLTAARRIQARN